MNKVAGRGRSSGRRKSSEGSVDSADFAANFRKTLAARAASLVSVEVARPAEAAKAGPPAFSATSPPSTGAVYRVYRELSASVVESSERESAVGEAPAERLPHNAAGRAELLRRVQEQGNPPLEDRFTDSKAPVDKYRKTSHNPPDMGLLHEYLRTTLGVPESLIPELAADIHALALARVKGEVAGRAAPVARGATQEKKTETPPLAAALEAMTLKDRRAALIEHYGLVLDKDGNYALPEEKKWANVRGENPTPEQFRAWLDAVFPDRQAIGMVLSDLKRLAPDAYGKLHTWANKKPAKATSDSFGLPSKRTSYDPTRDAIAPTELKNLRRSLGRAQYHHARLG